ncbi:MAG: ATP-binding protein [Burkholderiaceae bacterium]
MSTPPATLDTRPVQKIIKIRRDYNRWVADETLEDYALRFTPRHFRKWSMLRVANTAWGAVSFLALEAIGASITLSYGLSSAMSAIAVVSVLLFLTGLPIAYQAARNGLDMDLVARGAGFGYLGSTITSLIYAGFTFIFLALESAIMAQALELWFGLPRWLGYLISVIVIIPLVTHGVTLLSRLQLWTQPLWLMLGLAPFVAIAIKDPQAFQSLAALRGDGADGDAFSWAAFGAAATVIAALIGQIGEQVDFLRFMPERTRENRVRWWLAVVAAGPGWIVPGAIKMVAGAFLASLAIRHGATAAQAVEPTHMYRVGFEYVVGSGSLAVLLTGVFVVVSQIKINVTNAYAGSLAWSNFFARLTRSHPGRVVWLFFNVVIAVLLMTLGVFEALERVLGLYSHLAVAWVGALVGDLVVSKPLGWSPRRIEFKRAHLHDINPSGFGAMCIASLSSIAAYSGVFGDGLRSASSAIALAVSFVCAPLIAIATRGRYAIAREPVDFGPRHRTLRCVVCRNRFEADDMAACPAYNGAICSLCCTLEARCNDRCKPGRRLLEQLVDLLQRWLPRRLAPAVVRRSLQQCLLLAGMMLAFGALLWLLYTQETYRGDTFVAQSPPALRFLFLKIFLALGLLAAIASWWLVLTNESRQIAQQESERQNQLLQKEIDAHRRTDALLQRAKEHAESASLAKSRFVTGMSHELRSPLNSILGYSQILLRDRSLSTPQRDAVGTIRRNGEHLTGLVDGLLELSRIEAGKLRLEREPIELPEFLDQIVRMFEPLASDKGLRFRAEIDPHLPRQVHADPKRLRQILINLLSNAIKFTVAGSVTLRVRHLREIAHIQVEDTGIGIAATDLERIFLPFERADGAAMAEGTGLGLTITRMLVDLMGGDVKLRSTPGIGSSFMVRAYLPALREVGERIAPQALSGYLGPRRTILVVDDQPSHRAVLRGLLEPLGFAIVEAGTAADGLAAFEAARPDLVLLDINLPDATGWTVCRTLRARGHSELPVVMTSANAYENNADTWLRYGCDGFVCKPVGDTELFSVLRRLLNLTWTDDAGSRPASEDLRELLELASGAYPRALRARIAELRAEQPSLATWLDALTAMLDGPNDALCRHLATALQERDERATRSI